MSQLIQHYQTSFVVCNDTQTGENKLYQAQRLIGKWIKSHETHRFKAFGRDSKASFKIDGGFTKRARYSSSHSWCKTDYCIMDGSNAWAVEYTHRDSKVRDVFWVSEIGLRSFSDTGRLVVNVKISYKLTTEFALTGADFKPSVSIPWCVEGLLKTFKGSKFLSGGVDVTGGMSQAVTITSVELANRVLEYVNSPNRMLGVVLIMGDTEAAKHEADYLSRNLFGKALVFILPYKPEIRKVFSSFRLEFNECLFNPSFRLRDPALKNKLRYSLGDPKITESRHSVILRAWLGVQPINEDGSVCSLENVQLLLRHVLYSRLEETIERCVPADEFEKVKSELQDMSGLFKLSEEEKQELESKKKTLEQQVEELQDINLSLQIEKEDLKDAHAEELFKVKAKHESLVRKSKGDDGILPREYPDSFEALRLYEGFYKHLAFANCAWGPALEYDTFREFKIAWQMLYDLDQVLWPIIFEEGGGDIEHKFECRSSFGYAKGEGKQTSSDKKLVSKRKFVFEGRDWWMWTHVKYQNTAGRQLRIHFAIDNDKRRIIIGYIGEHMDNATTKKMH